MWQTTSGTRNIPTPWTPSQLLFRKPIAVNNEKTAAYLHVQEPVKLAAIEKFSSAFSGGKDPDLDVLDHMEPL